MTIYRLQNPVQNYPWGSTTEIPELLGEDNPDQKPVAELWLGAHPKAPSSVLTGQGEQSLIELIQAEPDAVLGADTVKRFGARLPFLLKVLAAEKALALQVHPTEAQALSGFERENALGVRPGAAQRNYLDKNHKPEMICALEPFECLAGFRSPGRIARDLKSLYLRTAGEDIDRFARSPSGEGLKRFFESVLLSTDRRKRMFVQEVIGRAAKMRAARYKWIVELNRQYPGDIGVVSPLFLKFLRLRPGQAVYIAPGTVHAYLRGLGIELMANSDNVVRGGLSIRHVDMHGFLRILRYNENPVEPIDPHAVGNGIEMYETPAQDFRLRRVRLQGGSCRVSARNRTVEIMICIEGAAALRYGRKEEHIAVRRGESLLIPADVAEYILEGEGTFFFAGVRGVRAVNG